MKFDDNKIVFYDGDCGFCNHSIQFILKKEKNKTLYFASLQSEFAKLFFSKLNQKINLDTFYYWDKKNLLSKSTAALELCKLLKFPYNFLYVFKLKPRFLRDSLYDYIAKRRKKIAKNYCVKPDNSDFNRFIQ